MSSKNKIMISLLVLLIIGITGVSSNLIFSNRSTSVPPEKITYTIEEPTDMQFIYENDNFKFYFRDARDVLAVYDKRNDVTHLTGLDVPVGANVRLDCEDALKAEEQPLIDETCVPIEDRLNQTWTDFANSLVTLEFFDDGNNLKWTSSANQDYSRSSFSRISSDSHWALDIEFNRIDVDVRVHLYFSEKGVEFEIKPNQVTGEGVSSINNIIIAPFLDAQGGKEIEFNGTEYNREEAVSKPSNDGYILVPDGAGALIRFKQNDVSISNYTGFIYGRDITSTLTSNKVETDYLAPKQMTLPVFGLSQGNDTEAAFIAYATAGEEYMKVVARPHNNKTWYNFAYASFTLNESFFQTFNTNDEGFNTIRESVQVENYKIQYHFLAGDGSTDNLPASYVGMALAYRDYLEENGLGDLKSNQNQDIPLRLDFLMGDVRKDLFGYEDVVVTNLKDVESILGDMNTAGLSNINSGLLGYRSGGLTASKIGSSSVSRKIGGKSDMKSLVQTADSYGYDVSFITDYTNITELQFNALFNLAPAKHISGKYLTYEIKDYQTINTYNLLRTDKALDWLESDVAYSTKLNMESITVNGLSNTLFSEYKRGLTRSDNMDLVIEGISSIENLKINASNPNAYLLPYVDRYLDTPAYSSHFLIETDTVPFLQLVLSSNIEMYATYGNFNITTYNDILRMIDFNIYPSFILTKEPSYLLEDTNSFIYYSTQYDFYQDEIVEIYDDINNALKEVQNADWIGRTVLAEGVVMNTYSNGVEIIINYNDTDFNGVTTVEANSYEVIK